MSRGKYNEDSYVRCPFYCKESSLDIRCDGIIGNHTTSDFTSVADKQAYKDDFCCGLFQSCMIYQMLEEKLTYC